MDTIADETYLNGSADIAETPKTTITPYETDPDRIPRDDPFLAQSTRYGRYAPRPDDFTPRYKDWYHSDPDATEFWKEVAQRFCTPDHSLNVLGPREAFAAGSVIIQVDREPAEGTAAERFSCANANELSSARKVEEALKGIGVAVPVIHFCGTIEGRNVTVESRIPGVTLDVAWRYLNVRQIEIFKNQCRQILQHLEAIDPSLDEPSYVCRGLNSQTPLPGHEQEHSILFAAKDAEEELRLAHNDLVPANIIVSNDRVVGIKGWRQSGYFGIDRSRKVHKLVRNKGPSTMDDGLGATWVDLYDGTYDSNKSPPLAASQDTPLPSVQTEPSGLTVDRIPASDDPETRSWGHDGAADHPTSKTLANLKNGVTSRASSSDRSSPATSVKPASNKKAASAASKKGTAKKPAAKKRKVNDADTDSVDGRRSNTPASRSSKTAGKKQDSVSVAGSPAPEEKKKPKKRPGKGRVAENDDENDDDEGVFCICRRPDNHTWMIGCDGDCEDWFHGKCVNIDPRDADLIDRKPARATRKNPSKYCSDEHGKEFMRRQLRHLKSRPQRKGQEDLGSMGGVLTPADLKAAIMGVSSIREFRTLGDQIIPPSLSSTKESTPSVGSRAETKFQNDDMFGLGLNMDSGIYSAEEIAKLEKLADVRSRIEHRKEMLAARSTFVNLLRPRAKGLVEKLKQKEPKGGWKDICGFDSRLSWSDEEFDAWRLSEAGKKGLAEGTPEALAAGSPTTDADGDTAMEDKDGEELAVLSRGVCTKKRCERHKQWMKVQIQDIVFEQNTAEQDLAKNEEEARSVAERAVLRKWAEKENMPGTQ
ncbi:hypothetical protein N7492_008599 [Penicillium capsulatum]|uniref:Zinc finger PHD-type domain-containing protein n=1 Tax=Penicillium capsulatum TaxID=69766 RepID=A0A9W9HTS7_9EURO|nr:hypothetical protein N7492_008599 [Penicillium capsulatum]